MIFESFVQIGTGFLRNRGILNVRWATIIGGLVCGIIGYGILAISINIWTAYLGYAVLGGIGSGMVYSSCINIVAKWYPEKKGWRTGFVNGGWAYGSVPFILVIGGFMTGGGVGNLSPHTVKVFIITQGGQLRIDLRVQGPRRQLRRRPGHPGHDRDLYGSAHYHWVFGFFFGAALGFVAMLTVVFLVRRPTEQEMGAAVRAAPDQAREPKEAMA